MQTVVSEEPFETAENLEDEEEGYEGYEDTNAPGYSDSDEEEEKGRYVERMNALTTAMLINKKEEGTFEQEEVHEKPADPAENPER